MPEDTPTIVENRNEMAIIWSASNCNPNGDPKAGDNRPRVDPETQKAIVTDVRVKRYLRDQLAQDGHGIYIKDARFDDQQATREQLLQDRLDQINLDEIDEEDLKDEIFNKFLDGSTDIRYFGATMGVDTDDERINESLPNHFTGPVQFSPGRSLHPVQINEESNSLTSVIATKDNKQSGGYDLDDHRIRFGLIAMNGVVNENNAADTRLTETDVERLDTLWWRAMKNQTLTRSKIGQQPEFYLRVEYSEDNFHIGNLTEFLKIDDNNSTDIEKARTTTDLTVDLTELIETLEAYKERIEAIHLNTSPRFTFSVDKVEESSDSLIDLLNGIMGETTVHEINVWEERDGTLPN